MSSIVCAIFQQLFIFNIDSILVEKSPKNPRILLGSYLLSVWTRMPLMFRDALFIGFCLLEVSLCEMLPEIGDRDIRVDVLRVVWEKICLQIVVIG